MGPTTDQVASASLTSLSPFALKSISARMERKIWRSSARAHLINEMGARRDFVFEGLCPSPRPNESRAGPGPREQGDRGPTPWFGAPAPNNGFINEVELERAAGVERSAIAVAGVA